MVGDINFNFNREIRNPRVIGVIVGLILVGWGMIVGGGSPLIGAVLGLAGLGVIFASVAPRAFEHFVSWLLKQISNALRE